MTDDMFEVFPEGNRQYLEARDMIVFECMERTLEPGRSYSREEIFDLIKERVDPDLEFRGFPRLTLKGSRTTGTNLISVLNNLWWNDLVSKLARGFDQRSGRPYGVRWVMDPG